jgi:alkylhydroperoxidase family enzyme
LTLVSSFDPTGYPPSEGGIVARIEPVPYDDLSDETKAMMDAGTASGMYTTIVPMQIIAYSTAAVTSMHRSYEATFRKGILEPRLVELLRLHSAQTAMCAPCSTSRKDDSISDDDVACLISPDAARFNPRERAAMSFFDQLANDHHAIDNDTFRSLAEVFTTAEIIEMAYLCSTFLGGHRLMHAIGAFAAMSGDDGPAVLPYAPGSVDLATVAQPVGV